MDEKEQLWYKDDQFKNQYSAEFQKKQIENRWKIFKNIILKHNFNSSKELKVLDLGCGDGINILGIINILNELGINKYTIKGTDFNEDRLKKVKKRFPEVEVEKIDIVNDIIKEKYHLIIFNHVLEHIEDDEKALKKLSNILDKNGLVILGVPNEGCLIAQIRNNILQRKILKVTDHVHFYTLDTLLEKVEKYLNIVDIYREGYFMPHDRLSYFLKKYKIGQNFLSFMLKINPSQAAGLILGLTKR